jgi:hypothetical protein
VNKNECTHDQKDWFMHTSSIGDLSSLKKFSIKEGHKHLINKKGRKNFIC